MKTILPLAFVALLPSSCANPEAENWKRRWNDDTTALANELKIAAQKIADASNADSRTAAVRFVALTGWASAILAFLAHLPMTSQVKCFLMQR
jgi:hypothetical protein